MHKINFADKKRNQPIRSESDELNIKPELYPDSDIRNIWIIGVSKSFYQINSEDPENI